MRKRYRVFLPKSIRWLIMPIFLFVWVIITVATFLPGDSAERPDFFVWLMVTVVLLFIGVFMWMHSSGRWPVYILEAEEDDGSN